MSSFNFQNTVALQKSFESHQYVSRWSYWCHGVFRTLDQSTPFFVPALLCYLSLQVLQTMFKAVTCEIKLALKSLAKV